MYHEIQSIANTSKVKFTNAINQQGKSSLEILILTTLSPPVYLHFSSHSGHLFYPIKGNTETAERLGDSANPLHWLPPLIHAPPPRLPAHADAQHTTEPPYSVTH